MTALADVRAEVAEALEGGEWEVLPGPVDAVAGPCLMVTSGTGEPLAVGCNWTARPSVILIGGGVDIPASADILDAMTGWAVARLSAAGVLVERWEDERRTSFGGVDYMTRRLVIRTTVTIR